jgi:hypothetical protein
VGLLLDDWFRWEGTLGFGDLHNQVRYLFSLSGGYIYSFYAFLFITAVLGECGVYTRIDTCNGDNSNQTRFSRGAAVKIFDAF